MKIKRLSREDHFKVIQKYKYTERPVALFGKPGLSALLEIDEVSASFTRPAPDQVPITFLDAGYKWLHIMDDDATLLITGFINTEKHLFEYYADMICGSFKCDDGVTAVYDNYLDYLVYGKGKYKKLDMDELTDAYNTGNITKKQYLGALDTARRFEDMGFTNKDKLDELFYNIIDTYYPDMDLIDKQ